MHLGTTMTVASSDGAFSGSMEVVAEIADDVLNWTIDLLDAEIVDQFQVEFFRPEEWDDKQVLLRASLVEGALHVRVFVLVYSGADRYSYLIGEG
jgi:hypothetical protein